MAFFDFNSIYSFTRWMVTYENSQGFPEKFLALCNQKIKTTEFPNVQTSLEDYDTGGIFFNKEQSKMLCVTFQKSKFKKFGIFFRGFAYGNAVLYSLIKTIDQGFWDAVTGKTQGEIIAKIQSKCKNLSQLDEFEALTSLGDLVFHDAIRALDPNFERDKHLFNLKQN